MLTTISRYRMSDIIKDARGRLLLSLRPRLEYDQEDEDIIHEVAPGDTLWTLAAQYFNGIPFAHTLWWAIADYQPDPIIDPTVRLEPGSLVVIPSPTLVQDALSGILEEDEADF
jgi:hypothetical protein